MSTTFTAGMASVWVQKDGPNTEPTLLGCAEVGDITIPEGDLTLFYCPDPSGPNKYLVRGSTKGAPGAITFSINVDFEDALSDIERIQFPFSLIINKLKRGRRDVFTNWDRSIVLLNTTFTQRSYTAIAAKTPDNNNRSEITGDISAEAALLPMPFTVSRQTISEVNAINGVSFCNQAQQRTEDNVARASCEIGFATCDAASGAKANVLYTSNGASWAATAADAFANDEHITGVGCFEVSRDDIRVIVARGTTDAGNPAEVGYSDDDGATWTLVNVGSTNGQFAPSAHSLFALDRNNIWLGTSGGYIYKSEDAGLSWTAQESGVINTGNWNGIHFITSDVGWAVGASNEIAKTIDGGATWSAVTGPSAQSGVAANVVFGLDKNRAWVGYADGDLYYTLDGGTTWSARSFTGSGVGQVRDISFRNDLEGYMLTNNASPVGTMHRTRDGGYTWETVTTATNSGLNAMHVCDQWKVFLVGEANASTGFIAKASS